MLKKDVASSILSITFMKDTVVNCYSDINKLISFIERYLKEYKKLMEALTYGSIEVIATKKYLLSPLSAFKGKTINLFNTLKIEYNERIDNTLIDIEFGKQKIYQLFSKLLDAFTDVLKLLEGVNELYDKEYMSNVNSIQKLQYEMKKLAKEKCINDKDSFMKYVVSTKMRSIKRIQKLKSLERTGKNTLMKTIETINSTLEKINNAQEALPCLYGDGITSILRVVDHILYSAAIVDTKKIIASIIQLKKEVSNISNDPIENIKDCFNENLEIIQFVAKFLESFIKKPICFNPNKNNKCKTNKDHQSIAIMDEWKEVLEHYANSKEQLKVKLFSYIEKDMGCKLNTILKTMNKYQEDFQIKPLCKFMDEFLINLIKHFEQDENLTREYISIIKACSLDISFNGLIGKLNYINLLESQNTHEVHVEDPNSTEDEKSDNDQHSINYKPKPKLLTKKFNISEPLIDSFSCALHWNILLQGRLYITKSYLCFYSSFNNSTIFGKNTKVVIPFFDVINIQTEYNALVFNNSICIRTSDAEFFFTSFLFRDKAYTLINQLCENSDKPNLDRKSVV